VFKERRKEIPPETFAKRKQLYLWWRRRTQVSENQIRWREELHLNSFNNHKFWLLKPLVDGGKFEENLARIQLEK
jgi:hypothetical protein